MLTLYWNKQKWKSEKCGSSLPRMPLQLNITQVRCRDKEEATVSSRNLNICNNSTLQLFLTRSDHYFSIIFWNVQNIYHWYTTNTIWQTKLIVNPASRIPHYLQIPSLVVCHTVYPNFTPLNGVLNIFWMHIWLPLSTESPESPNSPESPESPYSPKSPGWLGSQGLPIHQNHQNDQIHWNYQIHQIPIIIAFLYIGNSLLVCGEGKSRS